MLKIKTISVLTKEIVKVRIHDAIVAA